MAWQILCEEDVALVTINSNPVNAQNEAFFQDLHDAFDILEKDFTNLPVVFTATGSTFSAGIDFDHTFPIFASQDKDKVREWFERYRATNLRFFTYPRPTVAAINGHSFAGGLITALCCDYRISVNEAKFSLNEVPVGIPMPSIYAEIIRYAIGTPATAETILFGEVFTADEALKLGIVHNLVPPEELIQAAIQRAKLIEPESIPAYEASKRNLQYKTVQFINTMSAVLEEDMYTVVTTDESRAAHAKKYRQLKGKELSVMHS